MTQAPDLQAVLDAIAWARSCFSDALFSPHGSEEHTKAVEELRRSTVEARRLLERYDGTVALVSRTVLRAAELGLGRLTRTR